MRWILRARLKRAVATCAMVLALVGCKTRSLGESAVRSTPESTLDVVEGDLPPDHLRLLKETCGVLRRTMVGGIAVLALGMGVTSCANPDAAEPAPQFSSAQFVPLAENVSSNEVGNAVKRGFIDMVGASGEGGPDGVTDMIQVRNEDWFRGRQFEVMVFPGKQSESARGAGIQFQAPQKHTIDIGRLSGVTWGRMEAARPKIDTANLNAADAALVISRLQAERVDNQNVLRLNFIFSIHEQNRQWTEGNARVKAANLPGILDFNFDWMSFFHGRLNGDAQAVLADLVGRIGSEDYDINDYLYMDWQDMDGDKKDDFVMTLRPYSSFGNVRSRDAIVVVFWNDTAEGSTDVTINPEPSVRVVEGGFFHFSPNNLDWEQFDQRPGGDAILRSYLIGGKQQVAFWRNQFTSREQFDFVVTERSEPFETFSCSYGELWRPGTWGAVKEDTFDANLSGSDGVSEVVTFCNATHPVSGSEQGKTSMTTGWGIVFHSFTLSE